MKKAIVILLTLCMILPLVACVPAEETAETPKETTETTLPNRYEERPEDWDQEKELRKCFNGAFGARTVEELSPYVLSDTTQEQKEAFLAKIEAWRSQLPEGYPCFFDYPNDYVGASFQENNNGLETFLVFSASNYDFENDVFDWEDSQKNINDAKFSAGIVEGLIYVCGRPAVVVAIEGGKYVVCLEETITDKNTYVTCPTCSGEGGCWETEGGVCSYCGGEPPKNIFDVCYYCNGTYIKKWVKCTACKGTGFTKG